MLTITHTPTDGTLIDGTSRGDGSAEILKAARWRWSRNLGAWYVPRSRDAAPKRALIEETAAKLREDGFDVDVEIDDSWRPAADVEADRRTRLEGRATALASKADRLADAEDLADQRAHELSEQMPLGQPILIGHHSEGAMRTAYGRIQTANAKAHEAYAKAKEAARRAEVAESSTHAAEAPTTVANRIDRLGAEIRRGRRANWAARRLEQLVDQLNYWESVRQTQIKKGLVTDWKATDFAVGDLVRVLSGWWVVVRVNQTTLTVRSGTDVHRAPLNRIQERRPGQGGDQS